MKKLLLAVLSLSVLTACGGGGGAGASTASNAAVKSLPTQAVTITPTE